MARIRLPLTANCPQQGCERTRGMGVVGKSSVQARPITADSGMLRTSSWLCVSSVSPSPAVVAAVAVVVGLVGWM
ncbi:hypothetical protein ACKS0A_03405 [Histoplasma ohiense]